MTTFKRKLVAALSAGSMFLSLAAPAAAETTIILSGNGALSSNEADVELSNDTVVSQTNDARVENRITSTSSSGGNSASYNTGGEVLVKTGDATSNVDVQNLLNSNSAFVDCCDQGDLDIEISGNGYDSYNKVKVDDEDHREQYSGTNIFQNNYANVENDVESEAKTGANDAKYNTGGDVAVITGDATSTVDVATAANANVAQVGGNGDGGEISARILGNGAETYNKIDLELDDDILIQQYNDARIENDVDAKAASGYNDANMNTGGDVLIATGDATVDVEVDNMVNFNWADVDCGCLEDLLLKVAGNGYDAHSEIEFELDNDLNAFQENEWCVSDLMPSENSLLHFLHGRRNDCETDVEAEAKTGVNDADYNTGDVHGGDPAILTGDALSEVDVENTGNVNIFGEDGADLPWDFEFHFDMDFGDLWEMFHD